MKKHVFTVGMALALFSASPALAETLTNASIIQLSQAGLGAEAIIALIKNSPSQFDITTSSMIELKKANVADSIIAAMLSSSNKPSVSVNAYASSTSLNPLDPHTSGVYYVAVGATKMARIDSNTASQTKNGGGLASALTYGIAKRKIMAVLPNTNARIRGADKRPVFYFYFDSAAAGLSQNSANPFAAMMGQNQNPVSSPNEFTLLRLQVSGIDRQMDLGTLNIGGMKMGASDKQRIPFTYEELASGVFKVTPSVLLEPGEYGFIYSSGAGNVMAMYGMGGSNTKVFDFGVD
jgi:hypothetical protein